MFSLKIPNTRDRNFARWSGPWTRCPGTWNRFMSRDGIGPVHGIDAPICQDTRSGGLDDLLTSAEIGHDALVDLASEETFPAPDDLSLGSAVRRAGCDVINGRLMVPHADDDGSIERGVGFCQLECRRGTVAVCRATEDTDSRRKSSVTRCGCTTVRRSKL